MRHSAQRQTKSDSQNRKEWLLTKCLTGQTGWALKCITTLNSYRHSNQSTQGHKTLTQGCLTPKPKPLRELGRTCSRLPIWQRVYETRVPKCPLSVAKERAGALFQNICHEMENWKPECVGRGAGGGQRRQTFYCSQSKAAEKREQSSNGQEKKNDWLWELS